MTPARRYALEAGVLLVLLAAAFGAGRCSRPAKVVTHETVRTEVQYRDRVVTQVQHDVQIQHDVQVQTRTVTVTKWAKAPDGTPVVTQETHQEAQAASTTERQDVKLATATRETDALQATQETRTVTVEAARPAWSVTALAGGQWGGKQLVPGLPAPLVVGAVLERRFSGPVSVGLWGTSGAAGGVSVRLDF